MKDNLKWLLLIPVAVGLAVVLVVFIPKIMSGDSSGGTDTTPANSAQSQVSPEQMAQMQSSIDAGLSIVASNPTDALAIKDLGIAYEDMGKAQSDNQDTNGSLRSYKNAIDQFRKYLAINPGDAEVRIELGLAYVEMGLLDLGERELRTVTVAAPTNQRAWHSLGWALSQEGKMAEAKAAWSKSYNLNPTSAIGVESKSFLDQTAQGSSSAP